LGSYLDRSQSGPFAGDPRMSGRVPGAAGSPPAGFMNRQTSSFTEEKKKKIKIIKIRKK